MDTLGSNVSTAGATPSGISSDVPSYFQQNPDVQAAYAANTYGMTPDQFAQTHFQRFGQAEQRAAPPTYATVGTGITSGAPVNDYFLANPDVAQAYLNRAVDPNLASLVDATPEEFAATHYAKFGSDSENRGITSGVADQLVQSLYGSVGRTSPDLIDTAGRTALLGELQNKKYSDVASQFATNAVSDYTRFLNDPTNTANADMLRTGFSNLANTGVAGLLADNSLTLDEAAQLRSFAKKYDITPDELAGYVNRGATVVPGILNAFDSGVSALVGKAIDPATSEADKARIQMGLMQKYGLSYDDIARYSGGKLTVDDVTGFIEPIKSYGADFLGKLRGEEYMGADQLGQFLRANPAAREIYKDQQGYFDALAATKSGAATPEQVAAIASYLGYTNGWNDPQAVANDPGARNAFVGKPISEFLTYALTRVPGGQQGAPEDLREKASKLLAPLSAMDTQEFSQEQFFRGLQSGAISPEQGGAYNPEYVQQVLRDIDDPFINVGDESVRLSDLKAQGVSDAQIDTIKASYPQRTTSDTRPKFVRDPMSGKIFQFDTEGDTYFQSGGHQGGPDGSKNVGVSSQNRYVLDPATGQVKYQPGMTAYGTTKPLREALPVILAGLSLVPGVAPFAQAANAGMALSQGNYLAGIASILGMSMPGAEAAAGLEGVSKVPTIAQTIGLPSGVTSALNIGNAIQNKDLLGLLSQGAGAAGVDLKGLDLGGISVDRLLQGLGAVQAVQNGDIGGIMGLAGQAFGSPDVVNTAKFIRAAQAIASGNPATFAREVKRLTPKDNKPSEVQSASGGLLSDETSNGKVRPYYDGVASLLPVG